MKIAFIGIKGLPSQGGADRVVEAIVRLLAERHELTVYCSSCCTPRDSTVAGVHLVRVPSLPGKYTHMTVVDLLAAIHAVLWGSYDLVHVHNLEASFVIPLLKLRHRVVATAHGRTHTVEKWPRWARRVIALTEYPFVYAANVRTSVSQVHAEEWQQRFQRQVHYIPNGIGQPVESDDQAAGVVLEKHGVEAGGYILFAAGRILPLKGCHLLLEAFLQLDHQGPLALVVVGDMDQVPAYRQQLLHQAAGDERIRFIPFVSSQVLLMGLIKRARLFVFPSTNEAMSMMLLEAAALGAPILCSDIPGNRAVLERRATYFRSGDVNDLARQLDWALEHSEEMAELGRAAQSWVREHYTWESVAGRYESLYQQVVS